MKKIIFAAFIIGIIAMSWQPHCEHVFVSVEQPEITLQQGTVIVTLITEDGPRELICVKCLHQQDQVVKLIPREDDWDMPRMPHWPSTDVIKNAVTASPEYFQQKAKEARELTNRQLIDSFIKCPEPPSDWLIDSAGNLIKVPRTCW